MTFHHESTPLTLGLLSPQPCVWSESGWFAVLAGWLKCKCHWIVAFNCHLSACVWETSLKDPWGKKQDRRVCLAWFTAMSLWRKALQRERELEKDKESEPNWLFSRRERLYFEVQRQTDNQNIKGHAVIKVQTIYKSSKKSSLHCQRYRSRLYFSVTTRTCLSSLFMSQICPKMLNAHFNLMLC